MICLQRAYPSSLLAWELGVACPCADLYYGSKVNERPVSMNTCRQSHMTTSNSCLPMFYFCPKTISPALSEYAALPNRLPVRFLLPTCAGLSSSIEHKLKLLALTAFQIGHGARFHSPYGPKILLYADWAASGRALIPVERHISKHVLPLYANTHTTTSVAGLQSSCFRMEARQIIAQATNARVHYSDR